MNNYKLKLWKRFCEKHKIADKGVPLFSTSNNSVNIVEIGKVKKRHVLQRSPQMEKLVISEVEKVLDDFSTGLEQYEGLIYMMYRIDSGQITPLYIGKSEKYGKKGNNLSVNIEKIERNKGKFCRWGHQYDYHIGDQGGRSSTNIVKKLSRCSVVAVPKVILHQGLILVSQTCSTGSERMA